MYLLLTKQMRDSGLPADVLVGKLKKDISFALRRGTIAQVTTHHALDGYARPARCRGRGAPLNEVGGIARQSPFFLPLRRCFDLLLVTMLIKLPFLSMLIKLPFLSLSGKGA